nr:hypothetical protein [Tanacetum cinerariifolium]
MHMQLLHNNKVVIFDRTDFGPSNLTLPYGQICRLNDELVHPDCTAHSYEMLHGRLRKAGERQEPCDWIELERNLSVQRWYSSNAILPDGNIIIVGGRRAYSYEFYPRNPIGSTSNLKLFNLSFLVETNDYMEENNLYPFLHVLPDGNLFIFANQRSIL